MHLVKLERNVSTPKLSELASDRLFRILKLELGYQEAISRCTPPPLALDFRKELLQSVATMNRLAPKAVIDWLCGRIAGYTSIDGNEEVKAYWSTGKAGMTGTSYNGTIPLAAATTGVEGLEAIIPIAPNTSYYHYYRSNGLVRSPRGYLGEVIDVLFDFIHSGDKSKPAYNSKTVRDTEMKNGMDRITGDYNDFWAGRDYLNAMEKMKAAL
jgi:X-Pro dipeptidyl-peptidase